jgi:hypothetical protein
LQFVEGAVTGVEPRRAFVPFVTGFFIHRCQLLFSKLRIMRPRGRVLDKLTL